MPLSRPAGVCKFCFNLLSPFLSIVGILSSQTISLQVLLYAALFSRFLWSTLLYFPSYFKLHSLMYLGVDISTDDMIIIISLIFTTTATLSRRTSVDTLSTSLTPHNILILRRSIPRSLASSATLSSHVPQQCSKTDLTQH